MEGEDLEGGATEVGAMAEGGVGEVREGSEVAVPVFTAPAAAAAAVVLEGVGGHHRSSGEVAVAG